MILNILQAPDPRLRIIAKQVTVFDSALHQMIDAMIRTLTAKRGIGLAGTQVDYHYRVIVIKMPNDIPMCLVNPLIIAASGLDRDMEGCLSVDGGRKRIQKTRSRKIKVAYQSSTGEYLRLTAKGLLSACIQHEIDHLQGVLLSD